jgi:hypothetical protein
LSSAARPAHRVGALAKDLRVALVTWRNLASALLNVTAVEESSEGKVLVSAQIRKVDSAQKGTCPATPLHIQWSEG